jgi:hypothetical protein
MIWYAAHIVMVQRFVDGAAQDEFGVYENVYLVCADTEEEAFGKAEAIGRSKATVGGDQTWCGRPTKWEYAGIRKLILCGTMTERGEGPPKEGDEITYSQFTVSSEGDLDLLTQGESVAVQYEE